LWFAVHEDVDATMSSDDLGHFLVMARVWGGRQLLRGSRLLQLICLSTGCRPCRGNQ
jgi:hypothetical protein